MSDRALNACCSIIKLPQQVNLKHDEGRIEMLHQWIETLCDPDSNLILELNKSIQVKSFYLFFATEYSHLQYSEHKSY